MTTDNDRNIHHHTGGKEQSGSTAIKRTNAAHTYAKMTKSCGSTRTCTTNATQELYMDNNAPMRKSARLIFSLK